MPKQYYKVKNYQSRRSIGYLLRHASKLITGQLESVFTEADVSFVQWVILMNLRDGLASTSAELGKRICHDSGALTRVLDQMEARKMIRRTRSKTDRRIVDLEITAEGRKVTESFLPGVVTLYNSVLEEFTLKETDQLVSLLTRLSAKLATPLKESEA